jgi:hypothetical protein
VDPAESLQALCFAHRQEQLQSVLQWTACVILFSCPHARPGDSRWERIALILKAFSKPRRRHIIPKELATALGDDCLCFERGFSQSPVFSVHERQESSTGRGFWRKRIASSASLELRIFMLTILRLSARRRGFCTSRGRRLCQARHGV